MLSFATEFPVQGTNIEGFVRAVRSWLEGSPHTSLTADQLSTMPTDGHWSVGTAREKVEALLVTTDGRQTAAFKHAAFDGDLEWNTIVVYSGTEDDSWVSIRTSRESSHPQASLPPAKKPLLVRTLISKLGGGLDSELYVADKPFHLKSNDLGMATRLLNADAENYLPVVYVSCEFDGRVSVNFDALARSLGGMAHVLVEPNRDFSRKLQGEVGSRNVYGGRVGVYWPNGERNSYFFNEETPSDFDIRRLIVSRIRQALLNRRPLARCTWTRAEAEVARKVIENLKSSGSEDVSEYVSAFDVEMKAKNGQLEEAEAEVRRLKAQVRGFDVSQGYREFDLGISDEQEFFDGEFFEVLKGAVASAIESAQENGRRRHILQAIDKKIPSYENMKNRRESLKDVLREYKSMDRSIKQALEEMGFQISEEGKHYKLIYNQDDRYTFALPKTGGDRRGGLNAVSDIGKRVY